MWCPMLNTECRTNDCAWLDNNGDCYISSLKEIADRAEIIEAALADLKEAIEDVAEATANL